MRLKLLTLFGALFLIAACTTATEGGGGAAGAGGSTAPGSQGDLVANVGDRIFFDFDKFDIKPEARRTLERQAAWLRGNPRVSIIVEGHADERGTREYNLALGDRRSNSVKNFLVGLGISPGRVTTISFGKERPAALGSNEESWAQNRRGVTIVN